MSLKTRFVASLEKALLWIKCGSCSSESYLPVCCRILQKLWKEKHSLIPLCKPSSFSTTDRTVYSPIHTRCLSSKISNKASNVMHRTTVSLKWESVWRFTRSHWHPLFSVSIWHIYHLRARWQVLLLTFIWEEENTNIIIWKIVTVSTEWRSRSGAVTQRLKQRHDLRFSSADKPRSIWPQC